MALIIARLRTLINDPAGADETFSDDDIQDAADIHRTVVRYAELLPQPTPTPYTGVLQYLDYYGTEDHWESDAQIVGPAFQILTTDTQDYLTGHWTFAASQLPPVMIVGKYYDLYAAAADLLEKWAAKLKLKYRAASKDQQLQRDQMFTFCMQLAASYREKQEPVTITVTRSDIARSN